MTTPTALLDLPPLTAAGGPPPQEVSVPAQAQPETAPPPVPTPVPPPAGRGADEAWATAFGSPALGADCFTAAVDGDRVWIGGDFAYGVAGAANDTYLRVACWDGTGLVPLGTGVDAAVRAVVVVGSDVYVGGDFRSAGGKRAMHLARWDGTAWSAVVGGVDDPERSYGTTVNALATDGERLYVGGVFTRAGTTPANSLAVLDLATGTWSDAAGGVRSSWSTEPSEVRALAVQQGRLLVGGTFDRAGEVEATSLAAYDPVTGGWTGPGAVMNDDLQGFVSSLAVDGATGTAYVGGRFTRAGDVRAGSLVALSPEGVFTAVGDATSYGQPGEVVALAVSAGVLYAGGGFTTIGGADVDSLARWDGTDWTGVGDGVDNVVRVLEPLPGGGVVVLGDFTVSGELRVEHGGLWLGDRWDTFGQGVAADALGNGVVHAVLPDGPGAYVGGLFDQAGAQRVGSVARWDGSAWDVLGGGTAGQFGHGQVFALARIGTDVYAAGEFATAGGTVANNIARWDGATWSPLGDGLDDTAHCLAVLGGRLYVGGTFNRAGRLAVGHLACWDPATQTWSGVGNSPVYDDDIAALAVVADRWLVMGGTFQRFFVAGLPVLEGLWGMALFDTQAELDPGDPLSGYRVIAGTSRYGAPGWVNALRVVGGDLYVGGWFDVAGKVVLGDAPQPGFACPNLAVWHFGGDGTWESVGGGTDTQVQGLTEVDGALVAGGWFTRAGSAAAARVGRYDPATRTWSAFGSGLSDGAHGSSWALCVEQGDEAGLWVGGQFPVAGGLPSDNLALWRGTAVPAPAEDGTGGTGGDACPD